MLQSFNLVVLAAGIVLVLLSLTNRRFSAWGFNIEGPKGRPPRIIAFILGIIMTATAIGLESHSKNPEEKTDKANNSEQQFHQFMVGRWSAHKVVASTGYQYDSIIEFSKDGTYTESDFGNPQLHYGGTWTVVPISGDTFSLTLKLTTGTWTFTVNKLDRNSFKNEAEGYTA